MFKMCKKCHQETLFVSEPIYEGFKKIGESLRCNGCGAVQRSEYDEKIWVNVIESSEDQEILKIQELLLQCTA